ncbi:hypothetical protein CL615_00680 [archaeon]|jgi:acetylglutamate synthase|nr:hypothetical protein [archaeon]MDP6547684.1 hypothetical protein [Candidatus Woesearchaeota archaeon]|tara:strand:+ start:17742 stop:18269 length:528 start_codon:yes stop_codon:yes gene_type:complete
MVNQGIVYSDFTLFNQIDKEKFKELNHKRFGRELVKHYFQLFDPKYLRLALDKEDYVGGVVVVEASYFGEEIGFDYIDKLVVKQEYESNGIGTDLFEFAKKESEKLIWRARADNPYKKFYKTKKDRIEERDEWNIYSIGLNDKEWEDGIKYVLSKEDTFVSGIKEQDRLENHLKL